MIIITNIMTEIISIIAALSQPHHQQIHSNYHLYQLTQQTLLQLGFTSVLDQNQIGFVLEFQDVVKQKTFGVHLQNFYSFGTIIYSGMHAKFSFCLCDEFSLKIKASSTYHKIQLTKLTMLINEQLNKFAFKIHPISGQIQMEYSFLNEDRQKLLSILPSIIENLIESYSSENRYWRYILECLELIETNTLQNTSKQFNFNKNINNLLDYYWKKIEPLFSCIQIDAQESINRVHKSETEHFHNIYFFSQPRTLPFLSTHFSMIESQKKLIIQQQAKSLKLDTIRLRCFNFCYLHLEKNNINNRVFALLQIIEEELPNTFEHIIQGSEREFRLSFLRKSPEEIKREYLISERISRKKFFYTFIKQYVILSNCEQLKRYYIITKTQKNFNLIKMKDHLKKNQNTMSFEEKLKLILQYLLVAFLCITNFQDFSPSLSLSNLLITSKHMIKLQSLSKGKMTFLEQVSDTVSIILFNEKLLAYKRGKQINDQSCKVYGPSLMIRILMKFILDLQRNNFQETRAYKQTAESSSNNLIELNLRSERILSNTAILVGRMIDMINQSHRFGSKMWLGLI